MIWPQEQLSAVAGEVRTGPFGSQLHRSDYVEDVGATPVVMPKDISEGRIDMSSIARVGQGDVDRLSGHVLREADIVLARRGDIGRRAWVGEAEAGWLCGTGSMRIRLGDPARLRPRYLYYYLGTEPAIRWLEGHAVGATMSNLSASVVEKLPVPLPPSDVQDRIVSILDSMETLIQNNRRRVEILEEMARLNYREWFVHFRFPGHEDVGLVESDLGPIPEGWHVTALAEHASLQRRSVKPGDHPDETFNHYSIPAFDAGRLPVAELGADIKSGKYQVLGERVLLSKLNPRFPRVWRVDASQADRRAICSTEFLVLAADQDWPASFVYAVVGDSDFGGRLARMAGGTSTSHQRVKPGDVMALPIGGPNVSLVTQYAELVSPMLHLADNLIRQSEALREARDLLLPRLVSGELDVSVLDLELAEVG